MPYYSIAKQNIQYRAQEGKKEIYEGVKCQAHHDERRSSKIQDETCPLESLRSSYCRLLGHPVIV